MSVFTSSGQKDTYLQGRQYAAGLTGGEVLALYGELGAGKTTFVKGIVGYYLESKRVLSPTFIIVRHYSLQHKKIKHLLHVDLYRLKNAAEIVPLGLAEYFNRPDCIVMIEWADRMGKLLPHPRTDIYFKITGNDTRSIAVFDNSNH